jgi:hypothetical protein
VVGTFEADRVGLIVEPYGIGNMVALASIVIEGQNEPASVRARRRGVSVVAANLALALGWFGMADARLAHAAEGDKVAVESLLHAARDLMDQKRYAEACPKFMEAQRLDPTLGTLLNLAMCHESDGKIATAWTEYREVAALAKKDGQEDRAAVAGKRAAKLEALVPKLRIDAPHGPAGLIVKRDGAQLGSGALGTAIVLDPGEHTIEAFALGHQPWAAKVNIAASSGENIVAVPALLSSTAGADSQSGNSPHPMLTVGFVMVGAGLLSVGIGAILGGSTLSDAERARNDATLCPNNVCTPQGQAVMDGANTKATASNVLLISGGIIAAAGIAFVVIAPRINSAKSKTSLRIVPSVGGIFVQGHY